METKPWWQSKTVWVNLVVLLLGAGAYLLRGVQTGEIPIEIDAETVAMILGVIGIVLRFLTNKPLAR